MAEIVAWRVEINYYDGVVFAETKAKAKWKAVKHYWEAFGRTQYWPTCFINREPRFDGFYRKNEDNVWNENYLNECTR